MSPQPRTPQSHGSAAQAPPSRILRIGIILGGNIIEERLVRKREDITIGQSSRNTFSVPIEGLPKQFTLFGVENGRYVLHFTEKMDGRVSDGQGVRTLDSIKGRDAQKQGGYYRLPVGEHARGKITVGDMTLLFQFVAAPPLQPRPRLPASVRGTLADRVDPQLAIIMAISVLVHFAVALYAYQLPTKARSKAEEVRRKYEKDEFKTPKIALSDTNITAESEEGSGDEGEEDETEDKPKKVEEQPEKEGGGEGAPDDAQIQEDIQNTAFVSVLTGEGGESGRYDEMGTIDQGEELDDSIKNVKKSGANIASVGKPEGRKTRGPRSGRVGTDKGEKVGGPSDNVTTGKKEEEIVSEVKHKNAINLGAEETLDPSKVTRRIRSRYLSGIKRCHKRVLKRDPQAGGKVILRFTVGPSGRVTRAKVKSFDPTVSACIKGLTKRWRFGVPKDKRGQPSEADFQIPLLLKPGGA